MSDIYEKEVFEIVCSECSKLFESEDVNAEVCPDCWEKIVGAELENEGE